MLVKATGIEDGAVGDFRLQTAAGKDSHFSFLTEERRTFALNVPVGYVEVVQVGLTVSSLVDTNHPTVASESSFCVVSVN
jgi:hypothetical protein